jgi:hypothetical protein
MKKRTTAPTPPQFREAQHVPTSAGTRPFGSILADHQRQDFEATDPRDPRPGPRRRA